MYLRGKSIYLNSGFQTQYFYEKPILKYKFPKLLQSVLNVLINHQNIYDDTEIVGRTV